MLPEVIDLFSGCGGLALGFQKAGFHIAGGVDIVKEAVETASYNLHWRFGEESAHICGDLTKMSAPDICDGQAKGGYIVIGGPPCQAYSTPGKAKLNSLGPDRISTKDSRGELYQDFLRIALELNARAVVMENVPEAVNYGGKNIPQTVCQILEDRGYSTIWTILNAADYGVPQSRDRMFVIAVRKDQGFLPELPEAKYHTWQETTGLETRYKNFPNLSGFRMPPAYADNLPEWITAGEALNDLPVLHPEEDSPYRMRKITLSLPYRAAAACSYQELMRSWYGPELNKVTANCYRKTVRDFPIFARMKQGDTYLEASQIADQLFSNECQIQNITEEESPEEYAELKKKIVPPYNRETFITRWQKLREDSPSHTLVAHLAVDTYSHIHPSEPRGISVREAARLQSFPDGFLFQCNMGDAFRQIGNAVPPLLAAAIASVLYRQFKETDKNGTD